MWIIIILWDSDDLIISLNLWYLGPVDTAPTYLFVP